MGTPLLVVVIIIAFAVVFGVLNKVFADSKAKYKKRSLQNIAREDDFGMTVGQDFIDENPDKFGEAVINVPVLGGIYNKLKKSGSPLNLLTYLAILIVILVGVSYGGILMFKRPVIGIPMGIFAMLVFNNVYIGRRLNKRNEMFLTDFPDAIDMIVRSVRSGHPLLSSLKLISQNGRPPLSTEFQRVVDEVSYGRPLSESLRKMADRIGILDVNFFVVILSVQQETGGSMAEVLSNLSTIIRKRKQLNLKIKALTSEGRITTWMFSCIPFLQMAVVYFIKPDYLDPLFDTDAGVVCLIISLSLISLAIYIARQLCKMDI